MANVDINVFTVARKICFIREKWAGTVRCPAELLQRRLGTVRCRTICDHAREKSYGARAIINFAGDFQIDENVRRQFYL